MNYIISLDEIKNIEIDVIGGKALNLGKLIEAGYNVPRGHVLTTMAYDRFLAENGIDESNIDQTLDINEMIFPPDVVDELHEIDSFIDTNLLAVRSSATAEDLPEQSYAGQYGTELEVNGWNELVKAIMKCWLSLFSRHVSQYNSKNTSGGRLRMAVIIQSLVEADSAGVSFSVNPVNGNRKEVVVSSVFGLGEQLVSGSSIADEWVVRKDVIEEKNIVNKSLEEAQIREVADKTKSIENLFQVPQDVEWAFANNELFILQSRPISVIYEEVDWKAPQSGLWLRNFRLGEWLDSPLTPLFASWLLPQLENQLYHNLDIATNIPSPEPYHVIVNGWYFATGNFLPKNPLDAFWKLFRYLLPGFIRGPRRMAILVPKISYWGIKLYEEEWRKDILPEFLELIEEAKRKIGDISDLELFELLEQLTCQSGKFFYSLIAVAGSAWKPEHKFAKFYNKHISPMTTQNYQVLLQGLGAATTAPYDHAVTNLDWFHPTLGEMMNLRSPEIDISKSSTATDQREKCTEQIITDLSNKPKLLSKFNRLLKEAQEVALVREEQIYKFTLAWPVMRQIIGLLGKSMEEKRHIEDPDDVYFLRREEVGDCITGETDCSFSELIAKRKLSWEKQNKLSPPLHLGKMSFIAKRVFNTFEGSARIDAGNDVILQGLPSSPGIVTGKVRVIYTLNDLDLFEKDEILVTRVTNPAWTILFTKAKGVITDMGSTMAHASLVAREYGIPAVVGTGNASSVLKTGQVIKLNGNLGIISNVGTY